jgi:hypothetical protein
MGKFLIDANDISVRCYLQPERMGVFKQHGAV